MSNYLLIMLSVICPVYNEEKYIVSCIESILQQDYPRNDMEVLFVDGMSTDRTREIIETYLLKYSFLRVLDNPEKIVPCAMRIRYMQKIIFQYLLSNLGNYKQIMLARFVELMC